MRRPRFKLGRSGRGRLSFGNCRDRLTVGNCRDRLTVGNCRDRLTVGNCRDRLTVGNCRDRLTTPEPEPAGANSPGRPTPLPPLAYDFVNLRPTGNGHWCRVDLQVCRGRLPQVGCEVLPRAVPNRPTSNRGGRLEPALRRTRPTSVDIMIRQAKAFPTKRCRKRQCPGTPHFGVPGKPVPFAQGFLDILSCSRAASTTRSGVKPNFVSNAFNGALAPNVLIPMMAPVFPA